MSLRVRRCASVDRALEHVRRVDESEFDQAGADGEFAEWDQDSSGSLDSDELYDGVYDTFDDDDSGSWDVTEWGDAGDSDWLE